MEATRNRSSKYIKLLLYILVVVLINVAGLTLFKRIDLTKNDIYSLSSVSRQVVSTLSEPLTIKVFFTKDLPAPHNATERYLHDMLQEYALYGNTYFNYRFYNVSPETEGISNAASTENREMARDYGINPVQIQIVEEDEVKFKQAFMGLVIIHGDIIERIPTITSTSGLEYKLTTAIQKLNNKVSALLNLEEKINVKLVLSSSIFNVAPYMGIRQLNSYPEQIEDVVKRLNPKTYNRLEFSYIDPSGDNAAAEALDSLDIMELSWPAIQNEQASVAPGKGLIGLLIQYKEDVRVIPILQVLRLPIFGTQYQLAEMAAVEEQINVNLERLVNINEDLGYLADFGTLETTPMGPRSQETLGLFSALVNKTYALKPISLATDNIPEGLKCLVIARPTEKLSDYALYQIDQAVMRGTNLAVFIDAFKENRPAGQQPFMANQMPNYVPLDTGLENLLSHYGVRIKKSLVLDENCFRQRRPPQQGGGDQPIYFAPIIQNENISKAFDFIRNIKGLITVKVSPLELDQQRIDAQGIEAHQLFASSNRSWEMRDRITLNPMFLQPPATDKEMASLPLAYLLEGKFTSYFKGKPMPEKPAEQEDQAGENGPGTEPSDEGTQKPDLSQISGKGLFREESPQTRIFVLASAEMLKDQLLDEQGSSTNSMFILNMIDALNGRADIAAMRSKVQSFNPLIETGAATKTIVKTINIAGLPLLVVAFGLIIWARRHARRKTIQLKFQGQ
jgi:ABC-2 type transport system permease protein